MFKIEGDNIKLTRGDVAVIGVKAMEDEETYHTFQVGDIIRFSIYEKGDYSKIKLRKDIEVESSTQEVEISLTSEETRIDSLINKKKDYWYEIELNPETNAQTIVGYDDENGAKIFSLYPEGVDE